MFYLRVCLFVRGLYCHALNAWTFRQFHGIIPHETLVVYNHQYRLLFSLKWIIMRVILGRNCVYEIGKPTATLKSMLLVFRHLSYITRNCWDDSAVVLNTHNMDYCQREKTDKTVVTSSCDNKFFLFRTNELYIQRLYRNVKSNVP